jgi:phosphocarrier protein HPr
MNSETPSSQTVMIVNSLGLHARAAGKLVNLTDQFNATVTLEKEAQVANTDSVMELMMLTAGQGDKIIIKATGPDAASALKAVINLVQNGFGEELT